MFFLWVCFIRINFDDTFDYEIMNLIILTYLRNKRLPWLNG